MVIFVTQTIFIMSSITDIDTVLILSQNRKTIYAHEGLILNTKVVADSEVGRTIFLGKPYRVREHRIINVGRGSITLRINLRETVIESGMLAYVSAGAIMEIISYFPDTEAGLLGFMNLPMASCSRQSIMTAKCTKETDMLWGLIGSAVSGQVYRKEYAEHLVLALYSSIVPENEDNVVVTRSRKEDLFNRFIELVEMTSQKMDVPYFAERLHVAPHYLSRVVSEISGITVMDWVRQNLILQAKVLLMNSDMTIENISEQLNFPNSPYFCRFFKRETGMTPTEYRKREM